MRPLRVEFAAPKLPSARMSPLAAIIVAACLLLGAVQGARGWRAHRQLAEVTRQPSAVSSAPAAASAGLPRPPYFDDAEKLAAAAAFDAGRVLASLESVREPGVRLHSLDINAYDAIAAARFELQDVVSLTAILESLNGVDVPANWEIVSLEAPRDGQPGVLRLRGQWK